MKVLAIIDSLSLGGAERLLATLADAGTREGIDLRVVSLAAPSGRVQQGMKSLLGDLGIRPSHLAVSRMSSPTGWVRLLRTVRESDCDVVHAHLQESSTLTPLLARLAGRGTVCTFHHVPAPLSRRDAIKERLAVAAASHSRAVVFVSRASMDAFASTYRRCPNWVVVPNGVDLEEFRPATGVRFPAELGIADGVPTALMVAAMRGRKGHEHAIEAWAGVVSRFPDAMLVLAGTGSEEERYRAQAESSGVRDKVVFCGLRGDIPTLLQAATMVVLPSQTEAFPTTLLEAAACGKPVIATRVGGIPEIVEDGETGLLVDYGDPAGLGAAVCGLLGDPDRVRRMGDAARALAERRFGADLWARRLKRVYSAAAQAHPVRASALERDLDVTGDRPT